MELLRVQPYNDIQVNFTIPDTIGVDVNAKATIIDMANLSIVDEPIFPYIDGGDTISYFVPGKYDADYRVIITAETEGTETLFDDTFEVRRAYATTDATVASDIAAFKKNEELARAIIDSIIPQGFYYKKKTYETTGLGADYLPLWVDAKRILQVYENNVLVYDIDAETNPRVYQITKDKTAIVEEYSGQINRTESAPNILPAGASDLLDLNYAYRGFPSTFDYRLVLEVGYTSVPSDITKATELLIDDIACGKMDYYKRYVSAYNTDQYKLQFDKRAFEGTGNILVDKILAKYAKSITRLGVL